MNEGLGGRAGGQNRQFRPNLKFDKIFRSRFLENYPKHAVRPKWK